MGLGRWREVKEYAARARALYAGTGDRTGETDSMLLMAGALIRWCRPAEAAALCRQAMGIQEEIGSVLGDFSGTLTFVYALLDCGSVDEAVHWAEHGLRHARSFGIPPHLIFNLCALGAARRAAGDFDDARKLHGEALDLSTRVHAPPFAEIAASKACADCVRGGDWEAAATYARTALQERNSLWPH
jgi:tetratricopeptide (TPR) repeat protein